MTQEQLAERAGVSSRTVRDLELAKVGRPRSATMKLLIEALRLSDTESASIAALARGESPDGEPALNIRPNQLPPGQTHFVGRIDHLRHLDALLPVDPSGEADQVAIVALSGPAGVGKTSLAVHWSNSVRERFPDGQLYLNLHGYAPGMPRSPLEGLGHLLHALGVVADRIPLDADEATAMYRSVLAGRRLLVVLDNARNAEQVRPLLGGGPGCAIVITSRDRLNGLAASHGIHRLNLEVLTHTESVALLESILGADRVEADTSAAHALVDLCAYLPLALQIAAANLAARPRLSLSDTVAALRDGDRFAALEAGGDAEAAVRNAFDYSYLALTPDARHLFRRLGASPCRDHTAATAAVLADISSDAAERILDRLAAVHLIHEEQPHRYTFHDLMRLYARERCEAEDGERQRDDALAHLYRWYLDRVVSAGRSLYPDMLRMPLPDGCPAEEFESKTDALVWVSAEIANLSAVIRHTAVHGPHEVSWLTADSLRGYFTHCRDAVTWLDVAQAGLIAAQADNQTRAQAACHQSAAQAHQCAGRYPEAIEHNKTALTLSRQADWKQGEATALNHLGTAHLGLGRLDEAASFYQQALDLNRRMGRRSGVASALTNLAIVYARLGHLRSATEHFTQALDIERQNGSVGAQAVTLGNLGEISHELGLFDVAMGYLKEAVSLARAVGSMSGEANAFIGLAAVHADAGDLHQAVECSRLAVDVAERTGDRRTLAAALNTQASVYGQLGHHQKALALHESSLRLAQAISNRTLEISAHIGLARMFLAQQRLPVALTHGEQALAVAVQGQYKVFEGQALDVLARVREMSGEHEVAFEYATRAARIREHCRSA